MNLIIKQMNTQKRLSPLQQQWADNRAKQLKAMVTSLGRTAARNGVCLFNCPYEAGSEYADVWQKAHSEEVNKMGEAILTA